MTDADHPMQDANDPERLPTEKITWALLLGRWVDFARSAVALPRDEEGRRLRASVADIIMLQAVWFALRDVETLDAAQQALGRDRAGVLIDRHAGAIEERYAEATMPAMVRELIDEARQQLSTAQAKANSTDTERAAEDAEKDAGASDAST